MLAYGQVLLLGLVWFASTFYPTDAVFSYPKQAREAKEGEFPWVVMITYITDRVATGSLVSRFYVVSVCPREGIFARNVPPEYLYSNHRVVAGSIYVKNILKNEGSQIRWIYYWEEHPKCRSGGETGYFAYDISVIKVREQFIFNEVVSPIPFIRDQKKMRQQVEDIIKNGRTCYMVGWGPHRFLSIDLNAVDPYTGGPVYVPDKNPTEPIDENYTYCAICVPKVLRVIEMSVMTKEQCDLKNKDPRYIGSFIYRRIPYPEDTFCVIGKGKDGDQYTMNRAGKPTTNDDGGPLTCQTPDGPLVVGHYSYGNKIATIEWTDFPSVFTRYDWGIHSWLNKFYSPSMFEKHWVDPTYPETKMYCPEYVHCGHIPPEW